MNTGLNKIFFINSAKFDAVDLDLNQSTLLLGDSGVGKSTIMRACLFFYAMDYNILGIDMSSNSKKTFVEWHFEINGSSHIAYKYRTQNGEFLFILSRVEHLRYTFVDLTNFEDDIYSIFLDEENRPVTYNRLLDNIRALRLDYFNTNKKDVYKKILCKDEYRNLTSDMKRDLKDTRYYLFQNKDHIETFGSYLSKIFLNSKVSDNNIKNILIKQIEGSIDNFFDGFTSVNLHSMNDSFTSLLKQSEDIKKFKEIIPLIEQTDENKKEFEYLKKIHKDKQIELLEIVDYSDEIKNKIEDEISKVKEEIEILKDDFTNSKNEFEEKKTSLKVKENELEKDIKKAQRLKLEFEKIDINKILEEDRKKSEYSQELLETKNKLEILNSDVSNEKNRLDSLINDTRESISKRYEDNIEKIDEKLKEYSNQRVEISNEERTKNFENDKLKDKIQDETNEFINLKNNKNTNELKIEHLKNSRLENDATKSLSENLQSINTELKIKESEKNKIQDAKNSCENDMKALSRNYTSLINELKDKHDEEISKIDANILEIDEQLNLNKNNIYGYIHKNNYPHKNKILKTVSKDVLFKTFEEEINVKNYDEDTLYGLNINTYDIESKYDSSVLENRRRELNIQKRTSIQKYKENCDKEEKQANKKKNEIKQLQRTLDEKFRNVIREIDSINKQISLYEELLQKETQQIRDENIKKATTLEIEIESLTKKINLKSENLNILKDEYQKKKSEIALWTKNENSKLDTLINELNNKKTQIRKSKDIEIDNAVKKLQNDFNELLKQKGKDVDSIKELKTQYGKLEKILKDIDENKKHIYDYENNKELIELIPNNKNKLDDIKKSVSQISENFKNLENIYEIDKEKANTKLSEIKKLSSLYDKFIKKVDSLDMYETNEDLISKRYSLEKVYSMIYQLETLLDEEQNMRSSIEMLSSRMIKDIRKICRKLDSDNRLNLPVINNENDDDNIYMLLNLFSKYLNAYQMGYSSEGDDSVFKNTKDTLSNYATTLRNLNDKLIAMQSNINQLNRVIENGIADINVIDKIKINFRQENNTVVEALKNLIEFSDKNSYIYLGDLGSSNENFDAVYDEMLMKISELLKEISSSKKDKIDLYDLTSIKFQIEENGTSHDIITLSDIGSNGTGILVRTIIYISLLEIVSKKARIDENQMFHCILDEIGQISANYFSELLLFTEKNKFVFLNGMPVVADDIVALYPTVYTGATEGKKSFMYETTITE